MILLHFSMSNLTSVCLFWRTIGDKLGEAKASGNLGNTLKVLGKFDEAIACCQRHLDISEDLGDKVSTSKLIDSLHDALWTVYSSSFQWQK